MAFTNMDFLTFNLMSWIWVSARAVGWFANYPKDRAQVVQLVRFVHKGMPQGLALEPLLFTLSINN